MWKKHYDIERDGQIDFFDNYQIPWNDDDSILVDNTDGIWHGNLLEFKLNINNTGKVLFQAIKYLSHLRIKGESVPARIMLIDLNSTKVYVYNSIDYLDDIQKIYIGAASKENNNFNENVTAYEEYDYSDMMQSAEVKKMLINKTSDKTDWYTPIDLDENCIVGWAKRYYQELPNASKGDFIGDETGQVKIIGEIRDPKHFKNLINPYKEKTNEKFKYLMDCLNADLNKKDLGAFYTPIPYCNKAAELVKMAVDRVPKGNDYIILDRCAGTGNLETALMGLYDRNKDELISHCIVSTYEYYEYKVLSERLGDKVRNIIPPTEVNVVYENGMVSNADALSKEYIENPLIKQYIDDENCTVILFENPPYSDSSAITYVEKGNISQRAKTRRKGSFVLEEFKKEISSFGGQQAVAREVSNLFIWSGFNYFLRQPTDSYIIFSPVKYYKNAHLIEKKFCDGFAFNRKYFHASESVISCILWSNEKSLEKSITLKTFDIENGDICRLKKHDISVPQVQHNISDFSDKRQFPEDYQSEKNIAVVGSDGYERKDWKYSKGRKPKFNTNIVGYMVSKSFMIDPKHYNLVRTNFDTALKNSYGFWLRKDNYLNELPMFVAKLFPTDKWYEKDVYFTTADEGNIFMEDNNFLKMCLIYTSLSNKNKCISFDGSDDHYYRNEICFDTTNGPTCASIDLERYENLKGTSLDLTEQNLLKLWNNILEEAKKCKNYNSNFTYGVYQINKELNTFHKEGSGQKKKIVYDYPTLNGYLGALRGNLKKYYKTHISKKMFQYELIK